MHPIRTLMACACTFVLALVGLSSSARAQDEAPPVVMLVPAPPGPPAYYLVPIAPPPPPVPPPDALAERMRRISLSLDSEVAIAHHTTSSASIPATGYSGPSFGISMAYRVSPHFVLGVGHLGVGVANFNGTTIFSASASPYAEFTLPLGRRWELYGQFGALLQANSNNGAITGAAGLYAGAGIRLFLARWLSIGGGVRAYYSLTDGLTLAGGSLSRGDLMFSAGLELGIHF